MSVQVIAAVFSGSRSRGASRLVLLALADVASDDGEVTAYKRSQKILMQKAAVSKASVGRAIDDLVALGEIEILRPGDGRRSTDYRIAVDRLRQGEGYQDEDPQDGPPGAASRDPRGSTVGTQGPQDDPPISTSLSVPGPSPSVMAAFDAFWLAYPSKVGKGAARTAWGRAVRKATPTEIIDGVVRYCSTERVRAGYVANPATWLNQERWTDEPDAPRSRLSKSTRSLVAWAERDHLTALEENCP